jgi:hypothetical protein
MKKQLMSTIAKQFETYTQERVSGFACLDSVNPWAYFPETRDNLGHDLGIPRRLRC